MREMAASPARPQGAVVGGVSEDPSSARPRVGLVAPLPPQVGGVPSVAQWLLVHEGEIGCRYEPFDLWRPAVGDSGGRVTVGTLVLQARNLARLLRWLPGAPRLAHYCVALNPTGLARDLAFLAVLRVAGRTSIAHVHGGSQLEQARRSRTYRGALRVLQRLSSAIVVIAPSLEDRLSEQGVRARVIMNAVPPAVRVTHRRSHGEAGLTALFVGSWGRDKGLPELLTAVAGARGHGADVTLRVVGRPRFRRDQLPIHRQIARLALDDAVSFAGVRIGAALSSEYAAADVLCLPSRAEGVPMVVLEAIAHALPVVASRTGGIEDIVVDGVSGVLVEVGDTSALEQALVTLASRPSRRRRIGVVGRDRVRRQADGGRIAAEWRRVYAEVGAA